MIFPSCGFPYTIYITIMHQFQTFTIVMIYAFTEFPKCNHYLYFHHTNMSGPSRKAMDPFTIITLLFKKTGYNRTYKRPPFGGHLTLYSTFQPFCMNVHGVYSAASCEILTIHFGIFIFKRLLRHLLIFPLFFTLKNTYEYDSLFRVAILQLIKNDSTIIILVEVKYAGKDNELIIFGSISNANY